MNNSLYKNHIITGQDYEPLLHKKGKQWVVLGLSTLMLAGMGVATNTATHADTNNNNSNQQTAVQAKVNANNPAVDNNKISTKNIQNNNGNEYQQKNVNGLGQQRQINNKNIGTQASDLHDALMKQDKQLQKKPVLNDQAPASVKSASVQKSNASKVTPSSASVKSINSSVATKVTPKSMGSVASNKVNKPLMKVSFKHNIGDSNNAQTKASDGHWIYDHGKYLSADNVSDWQNSISDYYGLSYKYSPSLQSLEFTSGILTWNGDDNDAFIGENFLGTKYSTPIPDPVTLTGSGNITSIKFDSDISISNVTDMSNMFINNSDLQSLDLGNKFDTSNVTNMEGIFDNDSNLTNLDLGNKFDTSNVTNMKDMFGNDSNLTNLDLGNNFNTGNVTDMSDMFSDDGDLTSLNLGNNFDTSKVSDMSDMFGGDGDLIRLDLGNNFNTGNVTNMNSMFYGDNNLQSLTIQSPNTKISDRNGSDDLLNMYKQLPDKDKNSNNYTLSAPNNFGKGNVGTFVRPANPKLIGTIKFYNNKDMIKSVPIYTGNNPIKIGTSAKSYIDENIPSDYKAINNTDNQEFNKSGIINVQIRHNKDISVNYIPYSWQQNPNPPHTIPPYYLGTNPNKVSDINEVIHNQDEDGITQPNKWLIDTSDTIFSQGENSNGPFVDIKVIKAPFALDYYCNGKWEGYSPNKAYTITEADLSKPENIKQMVDKLGGLPAGFNVNMKNPIGTIGNNQWSSGSFIDINVISHDTDIVDYSDASGKHISSDKIAGNYGDNAKSAMDNDKPNNYHIISGDTGKFTPNGIFHVIVAPNPITDTITFTNQNGTNVGNTTATGTPNTSFIITNIPINYSIDTTKNPSTLTYDGKSHTVYVIGIPVTVTANVHVIDKDINGNVVKTQTVPKTIHTRVGDNVTVNPKDFANSDYPADNNNSNTFTVQPNMPSNSSYLNPTFTYSVERAGELQIRYVDRVPGTLHYNKVVGTQILPSLGLVGQTVYLGANGQFSGIGVDDVLNAPVGWHLLEFINPIKLTLRKGTLQPNGLRMMSLTLDITVPKKHPASAKSASVTPAKSASAKSTQSTKSTASSSATVPFISLASNTPSSVINNSNTYNSYSNFNNNDNNTYNYNNDSSAINSLESEVAANHDEIASLDNDFKSTEANHNISSSASATSTTPMIHQASSANSNSASISNNTDNQYISNPTSASDNNNRDVVNSLKSNHNSSNNSNVAPIEVKQNNIKPTVATNTNNINSDNDVTTIESTTSDVVSDIPSDTPFTLANPIPSDDGSDINNDIKLPQTNEDNNYVDVSVLAISLLALGIGMTGVDIEKKHEE